MRRALTAALLILAAVPLLLAVAELPPVGSVENPTYTHVIPRYLESGAEEAGAENIVTAIILNYRGYDTSGEVTVIFTALAAVAAVVAFTRREEGDGAPVPAVRANPVSPVVSFVVRVLAPFILMFSVYMILFGHSTPGGGFQGGAILGALAILSSLVLRTDRPLRPVGEGATRLLQVSAILAFVLVGMAGTVFFGAFLAFPSREGLKWLRTAELVFLEAGIGLGGAVIIASIFHMMEGQR
jgi:multicomponent Na+:H+ antiporter subunit B